MGFGDYAFEEMLLPSLTTIKPPSRLIGELAATRVLQAMGVLETDGEVERLNLLECSLVEREST